MSDERLIIAIGRIERALSRIEASATAAARAPAVDAGADDIRLRHDRLRARTADAIERLDLLIGGGGNGSGNGAGGGGAA